MVSSAAVLLRAVDLSADIAAMEAAGFALQAIFPADEPRRAEFSGHGIQVTLDSEVDVAPATIELAGAEPFELSGGARFVAPPGAAPAPERTFEFVHTRGGEAGTGRAGMQYRDLIPSRHGGRVIASHISVPGSGPVPDYVHYHDVGFQMIWCLSGRVKLVYEDQGDPFWMEAGDCVVQPPGIRHRVLESEDDLEVLEVALPAEHRTTIDHDMALPNGLDVGRDYGGQQFLFDRFVERTRAEMLGWDHSNTAVSAATGGRADVRTLASCRGAVSLGSRNHGELCVLFVLTGTATITSCKQRVEVAQHDSISIPPGEEWEVRDMSGDFEILEITIREVS